MATKDRKVSIGRRQQTASPSPKELRSTPDQTLKNDPSQDAQKTATSKTNIKAIHKTPLVRKLARGQPKKNPKKVATLKLNPKAKRKVTKKLAKNLLNSARVLDAKKLLKNGKIRPKKVKEEVDDGPPVLEPIFPIEDNLDKKPPKKKVVKNPAAKKIKVEPEDSAANSDSSVSSVKNATKKKIKTEFVDTVTETIEYVISGLALSPSEIKKEPDSLSESSRSDIIKPKKLTKKQKLTLLQKEIKKENIENALTNIGPSDQKVIDMLDLNVLKVKKTYPTQKRRHTIEQYPVRTNVANSDEFPPFNLFPSLPRSNSPRSKRKIRSSLEGKVLNPYTTRPPARLLRNGKQRKLKENLLDGLDSSRKKKKLNSDYSGSEISKISGYESDSSFSDFASLHGADEDVKKEEIVNHSGASTAIDPVQIKRSLSTDNQDYCTDTNSNVCSDLKVIENRETVDDKTEEDILLRDEVMYPRPSTKVPEKFIILDIMKQAFNEKVEDNKEDSPEPIRNSTEDLLPAEIEEKESEEKKMSEIISKIVETMGNEEFTATINTTEEGTAVVMQNGDIREKVTWEEKEEGDCQEVVPELPKAVEVPEEISKPDQEVPLLEELEAVVTQVEPVAEIPEKMEVVEESPSVPQVEVFEPTQEPPVLVPIAPVVETVVESMPCLVEETPVAEPIDVPSTSMSRDQASPILETEEEVAVKESILNALGLQSLKAAEEAKSKVKDKSPNKEEGYTGTLKTVIKLNRDTKKKGKNHPLKMTLQKNKSKGADGHSGNQDDYKIMKEGNTSWKHGNQSSDTAGAQRKTHYSNRSNPDGSSEHTSDGEVTNPEGPVKALVIPEKASSFSIHPERLCKDECSYCFGKFGLFDTPCHIAQIKSVERQDKILSYEKHLTRDSCLCDACYRHIDRKANTPSYVSKSYKRGPMIAPGPKENHCHVLACNNISTNVLRRKWIIKMKKQICQVINIDLDNPGLHSIPICDDHYIKLEHLMVCAMCKRRLARNHIHYIGPEVEDLNTALKEEEIPLNLADKPVVCKLCKCFATVILKNPEDRPENCTNFFVEYKKRLLHFNNIVLMNDAEAEEPIVVPTKDKIEKEPTRKKRKLSKNHTDDSSQPSSPTNEEVNAQKSSNNDQNNSRPDSPSDYLVDYQSLIPSIAMECEETETAKRKPDRRRSIPHLESISDTNSDLTVQLLGSNPSLSVRQLFPGEEELGLQGRIDFGTVKEKTPEGWEKCAMTVQYDKDTKQLWNDLQKPYGNPSSFLRHLILLEKYFRNGDLELKPSASQQSINYSESVQNRLRAFDNVPTGVSRPLTMQKSSSGIITSSNKDQKVMQTSVPGLPILTSPNVSVTTVRPPSVAITQLKNNPVISVTTTKSKPPPPPGLISLLPGTNRPIAPVLKPAQSQKIKFPITKNWRPTLIPIDPSKPAPEKKSGLVQVISGGKPYHITLEDYKKMCAIKRSFEAKQMRQQEIQMRAAQIVASGGSVLRTNKGLMITKARIEPKNEQDESTESILEKLDQQVENLESRFNENKTLINMPKIPKSLTVIPQTVARKTSRPGSPVLLITQKTSASLTSNNS